MKVVHTKNKVLNLCIFGLIVCAVFIADSIYYLSKNSSPTMYTLIFSYSVFSALGIIYYILRDKFRTDKKNLTDLSSINNPIINKILQVTFYITIAVILSYLSISLYTKPLTYYFLISLATTIIGFQIISTQYINKKQVYIILFFEIIPLAMIVRFSSFLINPYLIGPDVPWHFHLIQSIIENGHLNPVAQQYYYYPSYHLSQACSQIIIGISANSFNLINMIISTVSIISAYLIGNEVFENKKIGLMSALLLGISTMHIFLVTFNTSKIGGATLLITCLFLLLRRYKSSYVSKEMMLLFWIQSITLFFWHPEISFVHMLILGGYFLSVCIIRKEYYSISTFSLYLMWYMSFLLFINKSLFVDLVKDIFVEIPDSSLLIQTFSENSINYDLIIQLITSYLNITALMFVVAYVIIKWITSKKPMGFFFLILLMLIHLLPIIGITSGNFGADPARTFVYISFIITFIAAGGIFEAFDFRQKNNVLIFILILFVFSFFSMSSYLIGDGNDVFNDEIPIQTIFTTESTFASHKFLSETPKNNAILGDYETLRAISDPMRGFLHLDNQNIFRFSSEIINGFYLINYPNLKRLNFEDDFIGANIFNSLKTKNKIYNNRDICVFI